jgi:hypothetical protein
MPALAASVKHPFLGKYDGSLKMAKNPGNRGPLWYLPGGHTRRYDGRIGDLVSTPFQTSKVRRRLRCFRLEIKLDLAKPNEILLWDEPLEPENTSLAA